VSSVGPDICASFFLFASLPPCVAFSNLSLTHPFCYSARLVPRSREALFCVKPPPRDTHTHTHTHTRARRQRSEGTGPTEDRKDNVNAASISSLPPMDSANEIRKRRRLSNFESSLAIKLTLTSFDRSPLLLFMEEDEYRMNSRNNRYREIIGECRACKMRLNRRAREGIDDRVS